MTQTSTEIRRGLQECLGIIQTVQAVELLEYHDKNWLAWDNKKRCEEKINSLRLAQQLVEHVFNAAFPGELMEGATVEK